MRTRTARRRGAGPAEVPAVAPSVLGQDGDADGRGAVRGGYQEQTPVVTAADAAGDVADHEFGSLQEAAHEAGPADEDSVGPL